MNFELSFKVKMGPKNSQESDSENNSRRASLVKPPLSPNLAPRLHNSLKPVNSSDRKYSTVLIADEISRELSVFEEDRQNDSFFDSFKKLVSFGSSGSSTPASTPKIVTPVFTFKSSGPNSRADSAESIDYKNSESSGYKFARPILKTEVTLTEDNCDHLISADDNLVFLNTMSMGNRRKSKMNNEIASELQSSHFLGLADNEGPGCVRERRSSCQGRVSRPDKPSNQPRLSRSKSSDRRQLQPIDTEISRNVEFCSTNQLTASVRRSKWMKTSKVAGEKCNIGGKQRNTNFSSDDDLLKRGVLPTSLS